MTPSANDATLARTALLLMDVQVGVVDMIDPERVAVRRMASALGAARQAGVKVIYVTVQLRPGGLDVNPRNGAFSGASASGLFDVGAPATAIEPLIAPGPGEAIVVKKRISAFAGSDLDLVLRAHDIDSLVLTGLSTAGVVLSTLREAADRDFTLTVLADACADPDDEVHRVLTTKLFPNQATVLDTDTWVRSLDARRAAS